MDMLALMHEGTPYGHLTVGGEAVTDLQLARMVGETPGRVRRLLKELEAHGVFSRTDSGVMFSRRMVRDEHIRNVRAEAGRLGGNPNLTGDRKDNSEDRGKDNRLLKQTDKQKPTPSSSSSSSSSNLPALRVERGHKNYSAEFLKLWVAYPARSGSAAKEKASIQVAARLREGVPFEFLLEKTTAYRAWAEATGKVGTEKVMQASRFYGASKEYEQGNWSIAPAVNRADEARKRGYV